MSGNGNGIEVVKIRRLEGDSKLKAYVDVGFAGVFIVRGLKVMDGKNGLFVAMPQEQGKDGKWYPTAYPLTKEFKEVLSDQVLQAYENEG